MTVFVGTPARIVAIAEAHDISALELLQPGEQHVVRPVPPGDAGKSGRDVAGKALADRPRRHAAGHRIGSDAAADHRTGRNDCTVADDDARQHDRAVTNPDVVTDHYPV